MGGEGWLTLHAPDLANLAPFQLLYALWGWSCGGDGFPQPPSE